MSRRLAGDPYLQSASTDARRPLVQTRAVLLIGLGGLGRPEKDLDILGR